MVMAISGTPCGAQSDTLQRAEAGKMLAFVFLLFFFFFFSVFPPEICFVVSMVPDSYQIECCAGLECHLWGLCGACSSAQWMSNATKDLCSSLWWRAASQSCSEWQWEKQVMIPTSPGVTCSVFYLVSLRLCSDLLKSVWCRRSLTYGSMSWHWHWDPVCSPEVSIVWGRPGDASCLCDCLLGWIWKIWWMLICSHNSF